MNNNERRKRMNKLLQENFSLHEMFKILLNKRNLLTDDNLNLLEQTAEKYENRGVDHNDLLEVGTIGVIKAVQNFDGAQNGPLEARIVKCVEQEIEKFLNQQEEQ